MRLTIYYLFAYFYGSIPYIYIFTYFLKKKKVSGVITEKVNMANAFHYGGLPAGLFSAAGEVSKIVILLIYGRILKLENFVIYTALLIAVIGTMYSVFLKFKGSKTKITGETAIVLTNPIAGLIIFGIWVAVITTTKKAKLASVITTLSITPIMLLFKTNLEMFLFSLAITLLFFLKKDEKK